MDRKFTRGGFLVGGAAGLAALTGEELADAAVSDVAADGTRLCGVIQRTDFPRSIVIRSNGRKDVRFSDDPVFWKWTWRVNSEAFTVGDEVVAIGHWEDGFFSAARLECAYRDLRGKVLVREGNALTLSQTGAILFTDKTVAWGRLSSRPKPLDEISVGDDLLGTAIWEPLIGSAVAVRVGVTS